MSDTASGIESEIAGSRYNCRRTVCVILKDVPGPQFIKQFLYCYIPILFLEKEQCVIFTGQL